MKNRIISLGMALILAAAPRFSPWAAAEQAETISPSSETASPASEDSEAMGTVPDGEALPQAEEHGAEEPDREAILQALDAEQFGFDARVERDSDGNAVAVNGYPVRTVRAGLDIRNTDEPFQFGIDFVEYPFWQTAAQYDGNLAAMSLAMALSADRAVNRAGDPAEAFDPSLNLIQFLEDAGFTDLRKDDYSKETSMYTVSTAMGSRVMEAEGQEPFTLIAVGVCGAYYQNEWQSNMTPGEGPYHQGFLESAQLVIDRISGYILTRGIRGRIKLWISGFSRAAAVSNLTAGLMVRAGVFPKEDLYAYTFATPAAVLNPPESGYENIFNIISPMDLVPQVMPAEWGFGRFGQDLFLPTTEFTSIGSSITVYRGAVSRETFGLDTWYSPALNLRMRLLFSMLLNLLRNRENYNARFQPAVVGIMQNRKASTVLDTLRNLLLTMQGADSGEQQALDELLDFAVRMGGNALTRRELGAANRNTGGAGIRLLNEHREDSYLANAEMIRYGLFAETTECTYVMIHGPVRVKLTAEEMGDDYAITLTETGETEYSAIARLELDAMEGLQDNDQLYYMERIGQTSILAVEHDLKYRIEWEAVSDGEVEVRLARCFARARTDYPGYAVSPVPVKKGDTGVAFRVGWTGEDPLPGAFAESTLSAGEMAAFLGIASAGIRWRYGTMLLFLILGMLLAMVLGSVLWARRHGRGSGKLVWLCFGLYCASALETETAYWIFADQPGIRLAWKGILGVTLIAIFLLRHRTWAEIRKSGILPGLIAAAAADIVISVKFVPGAVLFLLCHVMLIRSFLKRCGMRRAQWIQWAVTSAVTCTVIILFFTAGRGPQGWAAAVYAPMLLLMTWSARNQPDRIRYSGAMLLVSDLLLGLYATLLPDPAVHMIYMGLFYLALIRLAAYREEGDLTKLTAS